MSQRPAIFVLSDATGNTAEKVTRAALVQFQHRRVALRMWPRVRTLDEASRVVALAASHGALLVHTLVNADLRAHVTRLSALHDVRAVDLIGALLAELADFLDDAPTQKPGVEIPLDDEYFRRIEAMEFTVTADDGQNPALLQRADVVLVGVSRTSKTPVSAYLSGQGYKVANVPIVRGIEPPPTLFELPPGRVFALTIDPMKLSEIRRRRLAHLGVDESGSYADEEHVFAEVRWALNLFRTRTTWPIIDVTRLAVEETAAELLKHKSRLELATPTEEAPE